MVGKDTHREESHLLAGAPRSSSEPVDNRFPAAMPWDELPVPDLPGHQAMAMDYHLDDATPIAPESNEGEEGTGADDALGLYLRQMGAIPLLNRQQELALAQRLELARSRYRRAALSNWRTIGRVVDTFERVLAGQLALDPTIDL